MEKEYEKAFEGKKIIILGGLGFVGSNLAHRLVILKPAKIVIVDSLIKGLGGNLKNIEGIENSLEIYAGQDWDMRNKEKMKWLLDKTEPDFIFNLAGSTSHVGSTDNPLFDVELNLLSHIVFLTVCKEYLEENRKNGIERNLKIVYAGTRDQYGKVKEEHLPIHENYFIFDVADPQGINKHAAEYYHLWFRNFGIKTASLRMANTYGPRHLMNDAGSGVMNWFIRQAMNNERLELWGGGEAIRDFNYIDDSVEAFLMVMASEKTDGEVYNLGSYIKKEGGLYVHLCENIKRIGETARTVMDVIKSGFIVDIPYPPKRKKIEPGHFYSDATKIYKAVGWEPKVSMREGIKKTEEFYKDKKNDYW